MHTTTRYVLDPTFGDNGVLELRPPGNFSNDMSALGTDASGALLIYGMYLREPFQGGQMGVSRLTDNGQIDCTFGDKQDGFTSAPNSLMPSAASSLALQGNGNFFITGPQSFKLPILQYDPNGKLISHFSAVHDRSLPTPRLVVLHDDSLWVASTTLDGGVIYGRHADGSANSNFGTQGQVNFLSESRFLAVHGMAFDNERQAVYVFGELNNDGFIGRFHLTGQLDESFADQGFYRINSNTVAYSSCRKVLILDNGGLLLMINTSATTGIAAGSLLRLTQSGEPDSDFNNGTPLLLPADVAEDIALQSDGKCVVAHRSYNNGNQLSRYLPDGQPDSSFGEDGVLTVPTEQISFLKSVQVQADGKLVIGGTQGSTSVFARLMR